MTGGTSGNDFCVMVDGRRDPVSPIGGLWEGSSEGVVEFVSPRSGSFSDRDDGDARSERLMRELCRRTAEDESSWTRESQMAVRRLFDNLAVDWALREERTVGTKALTDAYQRAGVSNGGMCLEIGSGTGRYTTWLSGMHTAVVACDLSLEMLTRGSRRPRCAIQGDGADLPIRTGSVDAVVAIDTILFPRSFERVLARDGALIVIYTAGPGTPMYLSPECALAALRDNWAGTASYAGRATWYVLRRAKGTW